MRLRGTYQSLVLVGCLMCGCDSPQVSGVKDDKNRSGEALTKETEPATRVDPLILEPISSAEGGDVVLRKNLKSATGSVKYEAGAVIASDIAGSYLTDGNVVPAGPSIKVIEIIGNDDGNLVAEVRLPLPDAIGEIPDNLVLFYEHHIAGSEGKFIGLLDAHALRARKRHNLIVVETKKLGTFQLGFVEQRERPTSRSLELPLVSFQAQTGSELAAVDYSMKFNKDSLQSFEFQVFRKQGREIPDCPSEPQAAGYVAHLNRDTIADLEMNFYDREFLNVNSYYGYRVCVYNRRGRLIPDMIYRHAKTASFDDLSPTPISIEPDQKLEPGTVAVPKSSYLPSGIFTTLDDLTVLLIDYELTLSLPDAGKMDFSQTPRCPSGSAVIAANDGLEATHMTCQALPDPKVFSTRLEELYQPREDSCLENEIVVGIVQVEKNRPAKILCSRVFSELQLVRHDLVDHVDQQATSKWRRQLVKPYTAADACLCPKNSFATGGFDASIDACTWKCAAVGLAE